MSEHLDMSTVTSVTIPITAENLPASDLHEADGSCWRAILSDDELSGWCWRPLNWTAFGKGEPDSEMTEFAVLNFSSVTKPPKMP